MGYVALPPHPVPVLTKIRSMRRDKRRPSWGDMGWQFFLTARRCDLRLTRPQHTKGGQEPNSMFIATFVFLGIGGFLVVASFCLLD